MVVVSVVIPVVGATVLHVLDLDGVVAVAAAAAVAATAAAAAAASAAEGVLEGAHQRGYGPSEAAAAAAAALLL